MHSMIVRLAAAAATISAVLVGSGSANAFPDKPVTLIVPWPPGGATDALARILAQRLGERLEQTVIVDNRPGAGGNIGTASFVREEADGHTLIMATSSTNAVNPHLYATLGFDPIADFAPVAFVASIPNLLEVPANSPFTDVASLVEFAKANPGQLNYASGGVGSSQHLAGSMFTHLTGTEITHVPYQGSGPAVTDLIAGHMDMMLDTGSLTQVKDGALRAIAVAAEERLPSLPDVPTIEEAGFGPMQASAWYAIAAPAGTPEPIVERLNADIVAVLARDDIRERLETMGAVLREPMSPAEVKAFFASEIARYESIVANSGASIN